MHDGSTVRSITLETHDEVMSHLRVVSCWIETLLEARIGHIVIATGSTKKSRMY